jgi:SAM-dependent MidA family methyltransferase
MIETVSSTSLSERLRERIDREGPITFRDWMSAALYDPEGGYYCRGDLERWGRAGDYRTSPERSSLFAATFARYFAHLYDELERPRALQIVEAGAGAGHFGHGVLASLERNFPDVFAATTYVVDEVSEHSRALVRERLQPFASRTAFTELEHETLSAGVIFANELLDAFPVHRVVWRAGEFREFYVTADSQGQFQWLEHDLSPELREPLADYIHLSGITPAAGVIIEINSEIDKWLRKIASVLKRGFLVIVDYGAAADQLFSDRANSEGTLRGFRKHEFVSDLLNSPGEHDLTATVNWTAVKASAARSGFELVEFASQNQFLLANGLLEELASQTSMATSDAAQMKLRSEARDLILPEGMASHFQVMVLKKS